MKKTIGEIKLRRKNGDIYSYRFKNTIGGTKHPRIIIIRPEVRYVFGTKCE